MVLANILKVKAICQLWIIFEILWHPRRFVDISISGPHLAVDVPVEAGCWEAVGGAAVGGQLLARAVQGQRAADHRALVRQV